MTALLFREDFVGPLHETDEDRRIREARVLPGQIGIEDPPGPRARTSDVDRNPVLDHLCQGIGERAPSPCADYCMYLTSQR